MTDPHDTPPGRFCWLDLAATDAARALAFYRDAFGWTGHEERANGGTPQSTRTDAELHAPPG